MSNNVAHYELPPMHGSALVWMTLAVSLATFMNLLNSTIANVSVPTIAGDLGVSLNQGTWIIIAFLVPNAISMPLTGWLAQRFGTVRLFVATILLFVLASLACGLSSNLEMLILFRAIQGGVSGPMVPLSQTLLLQSYPREKAGLALTSWGMTTLIAPVLGPVLGGWISDNFFWPWIFYINIPIGLIAAIATWRLLRHRESPIVKNPIDGIGLALLVIWVGAMQILIAKGRELDWFGSGEIQALAVITAIGLCFFIAWELTDEHPVVDLSLYRSSHFTSWSIITALAYGIFFGAVVLMPLWMQQYLGYTATLAGLATAPLGIFALILSPVVGKLLPKFDPRYFACASLLVFAAVMLMRSYFTLEVTLWMVILPQLIQGAGMAMLMVPLMALTLSGLHPSRISAASGLSNFMIRIASAFGTSLTMTLWDDRAALHHARLVEHINVYDDTTRQTIDSLSSRGMSHEQIMALLDRQVTAQAYQISANDFFLLATLLFVLLAISVWLVKSHQHIKMEPVRNAAVGIHPADG